MLTGNKVKKYLIVTCRNCSESFKIDWKDILDSKMDEGFICPWCEYEMNSAPFVLDSNLEYKIVDAD